MDIFFSCRKLVELKVVKQFGQPPSDVDPSAFVILKERQEDGKWVEIGQTESVPQSRNPDFSVAVKVRYKGPDVIQRMHVQVFSRAFKMPHGVPLGDCYFILDDLVHSRSARVMKLDIVSPNHQRKNGSITISGTQRVEVEDGVWMQVHLVADRLYGNNRPRASMELPQTYFEIWRQNEDSLVQVYRSETTTSPSIRVEWWPFALSGKRIGDSADCQLIVKLFNASDGVHKYVGETRFSLGECRAGKTFPILPEKEWKGRPTLQEGDPAVVVEDCKWIKLSNGAVLEAQPTYQKDLLFLKDLMENMELDAASKESIGSCMLFVRNRAKYWSMHDIVSSSLKLPSTTTTPLASAPRSRASSPHGSPAHSPLPLPNRTELAQPPPPPVAAAELSYAESVDAAVHRLRPHSPLSNREVNKNWRLKLQQLEQRTSSRQSTADSPITGENKVERLGKRFSVDLDVDEVKAISAATRVESPLGHSAQSPPPREAAGRPGTAGAVRPRTAGRSRAPITPPERAGFHLGDLTRIRVGAQSDRPAPSGPPTADPPSVRPQSARFAAKEEGWGRRRPETARARMEGRGPRARLRNHWRPDTARSSRPDTARSIPSHARPPTWPTGTAGSIEAVARTMEFRESIRPLLSALMRHGSACQHPSYVAPVSAAGLTPAGKFRFTKGLT